MSGQKAADPKKSETKADRRQLLVYLRPDTILRLKTEALHTERHVYEIVQDLVDAHYKDDKRQL